MVDVLTCASPVRTHSGNDGAVKNGKKRSSVTKRQSSVDDADKSVGSAQGTRVVKRNNHLGMPVNEPRSGPLTDSRHSSASAKKIKPARAKSEKTKRLSGVSNDLNSKIESAGTSASRASGVKPAKKKPTGRAKSFDGSLSVASRSLASRSVASSVTGTRKGKKKKTQKSATESGGAPDPKNIKASSDHTPSTASAIKKKLQRKQEESLLGSVPSIGSSPDTTFEEAPTTPNGRSRSASVNKDRRRGSGIKAEDTPKKERGRVTAKRQTAMGESSVKDPSNSYFPQRGSSQDISNSSSRHSTSASPKRTSSKGSTGRRRSSSNKAKPKLDKPKMPTRTVSDSSAIPTRNENNDSKASLRSANTSKSPRIEKDKALSPPTRNLSISSRGQRSMGIASEKLLDLNDKDGDESEEEDILADSARFLDKSRNEGFGQLDEKAIEKLSTPKEKRQVREMMPKKDQKKAPVAPARKKSDPEIMGLDDSGSIDESESESNRGNAFAKRLCGLKPQHKKPTSTESSVASSSMPVLFNSSFSSINTTDDSVCSYLSQKKPGLIVAADVNDGPMKQFLGNLTSTIETKRLCGPEGSKSSFGENSFPQLKGEAGPNKSAASLNASSKFSAGIKNLAGSSPKKKRGSESESSLPGLMAMKKNEEKIPPPPEPMPTQFEDDMEDSIPNLTGYELKDGSGAKRGSANPPPSGKNENGMDTSLPSLMSYGTKGSNSVALKQRKVAQEMDDSIPSLMSFRGVGSQQSDQDSSMPSLSSFRTTGTSATSSTPSALDESTGECSLPPLTVMKDASSLPGGASGRRPMASKNKSGPTGNPLHDIADTDESEETEEEYGPSEPDIEPWNESGTEYEESMTELDDSNLDESGGSQIDGSKGQDEESEEEEEEEEEDRLPHEEEEEKEEESHENDEEGSYDEDENDAGNDQEDNENESVSHSVIEFVVDSKKKKKKKEKDEKAEQVKKWQEEFQQEQMMQQQQIFWQQQQQLLHHQMMQQQFLMANGMNPQMMMNGLGAQLPSQMMGTNERLPNGNQVEEQSLSPQDLMGSNHSKNPSKKKSTVRHSQSLDYDFSFMDHPDMPEPSEISADDVFQPMNPSYKEKEEAGGSTKAAATKGGKKKDKEKKPPPMSFSSRFKKSVKKIKRNLSGGKPKSTAKVSTGLNEKHFFPDLEEDDDEEFTMKGLLSG